MRRFIFVVLLLAILVLSVQAGYYLLTSPDTDTQTESATGSDEFGDDRQAREADPDVPPLPVIRQRATPLKAPPPPASDTGESVESALLSALEADQAGANITSQAGNITIKLTPEGAAPELPPLDLLAIIDEESSLSIADDEADEVASVIIPLPSSQKSRRLTAPPGIRLYQVQMAAFRNEELAARTAALLNSHHKSRLRGIRIGITLVDIEDRGRFWRVVTEEMPRGEADHLCKTLKSAGQDCILRLTPAYP